MGLDLARGAKEGALVGTPRGVFGLTAVGHRLGGGGEWEGREAFFRRLDSSSVGAHGGSQ